MLIKLLNNNGEMILVNTDHIVKVKPYTNGIRIRFSDGEPEELIPDMTVEEFLVKTKEETTSSHKIAVDIIKRLDSLEHTIMGGFQYVGKSVH